MGKSEVGIPVVKQLWDPIGPSQAQCFQALRLSSADQACPLGAAAAGSLAASGRAQQARKDRNTQKVKPRSEVTAGASPLLIPSLLDPSLGR